MRLKIASAAAMLVLGMAGASLVSAQTAAPPPAPTPPHDPAIAQVVGGSWRTAADRTRDVHRHPSESLRVWGLRPNTTIVEIGPGAGWWTHILAPYARLTGGRYVAAFGDMGAPTVTDAARQARASFATLTGNAAVYGRVEVVDFSRRAGLAMPDRSADFILVSRAFHNWARQEGMTDRYMSEFARVLRPGGILAVEQHRAAAGADVAQTAPTGYVPESYVIDAARRAGLTLTARSEVNANPRDTRDHPFGVWTLPPIAQTAPNGSPPNPAFDRTRYDAIGESDRMTLRFMKPG